MNIDKPDFLTNEASKEWDRIMPLIPETQSRDVATIISYCLTWETIVRAVRELEGKPLTLEGAQGNTVVNPLILIRDRAQVRLIALAGQLGLSPKARLNAAAKKKPKSPLEM
jgi:P27 family predicted phage terminase small subunit